MSHTVYLVGHGRVDAKAPPLIVPANITLHWLAVLGDVTGGLSHAFMNGRLNQEYGQTTTGQSVAEHYLCGESGDVSWVTDGKIKNFFQRQVPDPQGDPDPSVLYPRGLTNVSLTSICAFLKEMCPSYHRHLYWTCCRGFIGVANPYATKYNSAQNAAVRELRVKPPETPVLSDKGHKTVVADYDSVIMMARSDAPLLDLDNPTHSLQKLCVRV